MLVRGHFRRFGQEQAKLLLSICSTVSDLWRGLGILRSVWKAHTVIRAMPNTSSTFPSRRKAKKRVSLMSK